jgi:hypothetical protein
MTMTHCFFCGEHVNYRTCTNINILITASPATSSASMDITLHSVHTSQVVVLLACSSSLSHIHKWLWCRLSKCRIFTQRLHFFIMGVIVESSQPHMGKLNSLTIRVFFVFFVFYFAVITCGYKGALTSSLSIVHETPPYSE